MRTFLTFAFVYGLILNSTVQAGVVVDFEGLPVPGTGFYNGNNRPGHDAFRGNYQVTGDQPGAFGGTEFLQLWDSGPAQFSNNYTQDSSFDSWSGFSWSNVVDTSTVGFSNQYAAFPGGGSNGAGGAVAGETYAMTFGSSAYFNIAAGYTLASVDVTNGTYGYLSMRDGDPPPFAFAKKFGGDTGNDPDHFQVILTGYDATGGSNGGGTSIGSVFVDLADFRFSDNSQDYILDSWLTVDTTSLAGARSIGISYFSTDSDATFGFINTPTYAAMDNFAFVPEPSSPALVLGGVIMGMGRRRRQRG